VTKQVTPHQAYEAIGRIHELLMQATDLCVELSVSPVRVGELKAAVSAARREAQFHQQAAEILLTQPMATEFPDCTPAPATLTAKQIFYLAALAMPDPIQARQLVGLPPSRQCLEKTKDDHKCGASSMVFSRRAVCWSHGTEAERERNRKQKAKWNRDHPDYQI
jgi:hypothetical protein